MKVCEVVEVLAQSSRLSAECKVKMFEEGEEPLAFNEYRSINELSEESSYITHREVIDWDIIASKSDQQGTVDKEIWFYTSDIKGSEE